MPICSSIFLPFVVATATTQSPSPRFIKRTPCVARPATPMVLTSVRITTPPAEIIIRSLSFPVITRAVATAPVFLVTFEVITPPPPRLCVGYSSMSVLLPYPFCLLDITQIDAVFAFGCAADISKHINPKLEDAPPIRKEEQSIVAVRNQQVANRVVFTSCHTRDATSPSALCAIRT